MHINTNIQILTTLIHIHAYHNNNTRTYIHDTEVHWNQEMRDGEGAEKGYTESQTEIVTRER